MVGADDTSEKLQLPVIPVQLFSGHTPVMYGMGSKTQKYIERPVLHTRLFWFSIVYLASSVSTFYSLNLFWCHLVWHDLWYV